MAVTVGSMDDLIANAMGTVIRDNPGRIFCRGIFIPCAELDDSEVTGMFDADVIDPDLSFTAWDGGDLLGFVACKIGDDAALVFLLEAVRDERFESTIELLLGKVLDAARQRDFNAAKLTPLQPLASAFNLKDDRLIDTLFKIGFWQDITIAAEMRIDLTGYRVPERIADREDKFRHDGIEFRPATNDDLPALDDLAERTGRHHWKSLIKDVFEQADPRYVILAVKNDQAIAYSTFFARTIDTSLPEYGPVLIDEPYRGKGVSSILMAKSLMQIAELGKAEEVQLSCYPNKFPVYPRQGYRFTEKYLFHATSRW